MKTYKTKKGYFYKELKNGKRTRISKEQYQKLRKKQTGKGFLFGEHECRKCRKRKSNSQFSNLHTTTNKQELIRRINNDLPYIPEIKHTTALNKEGTFVEGKFRVCQACKQRLEKINRMPESTKLIIKQGHSCPNCSYGYKEYFVVNNSNNSYSGYQPDGPKTTSVQCKKCSGIGYLNKKENFQKNKYIYIYI